MGHLLSIIVFLPIVGAIVLLFIDKENHSAIRVVAFVFSLVEFILSLPLAAKTDTGIWMSHSIPTKTHMRKFDDFIFEKILTIEDMTQNRSLDALLWDRRQTEDEQQVHDVRADRVAEAEATASSHSGQDRDRELGHRGTEAHYRQPDDHRRYAETQGDP